jgi:hypothetical protein
MLETYDLKNGKPIYSTMKLGSLLSKARFSERNIGGLKPIAVMVQLLGYVDFNLAIPSAASFLGK